VNELTNPPEDKKKLFYVEALSDYFEILDAMDELKRVLIRHNT
jgi:hypothetical protein